MTRTATAIEDAEDAIYEESKLLADIAAEVRALGFEPIAQRILTAHTQLGRDGDPETRLLAALPDLRTAADLLRHVGRLELAVRIRVSCQGMSRRVDRLQPITQPNIEIDDA